MKFKALAEIILGATQESTKLPYETDKHGNIFWLRVGGNLEGAPKIARGDFDCSDMCIESLKGAPESVSGAFFCHHNKLSQSLKGAPMTTGSHFSCENNQLLSLEGAPGAVGGNFNCSNNRLKSLKGAPEFIGNGFTCRNNPLKSLAHIPKAKNYQLPDGFSEKDAKKEVERREMAKNLDPETFNTFGDFFSEL